MNDLDLPPRRTLPPNVRERIRTRVDVVTPRSRYRGPLSVAAAVAVLAAGAVTVGQLAARTPDGDRVATPPPSVTVVPGSDPQLTVSQPNARSDEDLDHCWDAVEASQRTGDYAPRSAWEPVFTVTRARPGGTGGLLRVTAFRQRGGAPGFCEIGEIRSQAGTDSTATVSDPNAEPILLAGGGGADVRATFFSRTGFLAGVVRGVESLRLSTTIPHPDTGVPIHHEQPLVLQDRLFLVEVGGLSPGTAVAGGHPDASSTVATAGFDGDGDEVISGEWVYDEAKDPMVGPFLIY